MSTKQIRNIAIIAHVDHGKTTMVDQLLRQSGTFAEHEKVVDTVMDNNAIEKERGITILAKNCAVTWGGTHINIVASRFFPRTLRSSTKAFTSISSIPRVTRTSVVKSSAPCPWSMAWCS